VLIEHLRERIRELAHLAKDSHNSSRPPSSDSPFKEPPPRSQRQPSGRKPVDKAADYIDNNQERLQYDQALAYGLPVATGIIEGTCRYLVKDRPERRHFSRNSKWGPSDFGCTK